MDSITQLKRFQRLTAKVNGEYLEMKSLLSSGNLKLPKTTAIFNMSSATDCPAAKVGLCAAAKAGVKCYARKSENPMRKEVLPYRRSQQAYWEKVSGEKFALDFLSLNSMKPSPFTALRLNEAGDFHSQKCVEKAETIARILKDFGVTTYCYTSRSDLDFSQVRNLVVMGSGFMKEGIKSEFKIIQSKKDKPKGYGLCKMNCRSCKACQRRGVKIAVVKH